MQWIKKPKTKNYDKRTRRFFCWWPTETENRWVWLEWITIEETAFGGIWGDPLYIEPKKDSQGLLRSCESEINHSRR